MKQVAGILSFVFLLALAASGQQQAPGIFNYQGVARNAVGNVLINKTISLRLSIHDGSAAGPVVYQESRTVTTNPFGLFNVQVGSAGASNVTGAIAAVNLGVGAKFIQVEIDPNGGTAFINIGSAALASVPYSLYTSLANDLVLPFTKTQADPGALFKITNSGTGITLHTTGPVRLQGISEAANRILATDAAGNATWKDPAAVNIVTGNGTVNVIPKWTPAGTNIGNSQIADNGVSIGINTAAPNSSAQLDVSSTSKGILIPRMTTAQRTAIASPANGLLVFDNTTSSFWFYKGTGWTEIFSSSTGWGLSGNAGTNATLNFIGTTDDNDLIFKRNNTRAGLITTDNTSYGLNALNPGNTGSNNLAIGVSALRSNTIGTANTATGNSALSANTSGTFNTANGANALFFNTTGNGNTASGFGTLYNNTTGEYNTANGTAALFANTTGSFNTASGNNALTNNITGTNNTAAGASALQSNTSGSKNTAMGVTTLYANKTGSGNTACGFQALTSNTNGISNTAHGADALHSNITGSSNTANGASALYNNTTGTANTAAGLSALFYNATGDFNTAIGSSTLTLNTTGDFNTAIGSGALISTTGSNNTGIGNDAQVPVAAGSNQVRIGNTAVTYAGVQVAWTITSDRRSKADIKTTGLGLDFIKTLNPVSYRRSNDESKKTEYGFIAQEVEEALNRAGATNTGIITRDDAGHYGMRYNDLLAPMVKAIQQQQELLEKQQATIEQLQRRLAALEQKEHR